MLSRLVRYVGTASVSVSNSIIIPNNNKKKLFHPPRPLVSYLRSFCSMTTSYNSRLLIHPTAVDHNYGHLMFNRLLSDDGYFSISDFNYLFSSLQKRGNLLTVLQLFERWENSLTVLPNIDTLTILIHCHCLSTEYGGNISSAFSLFRDIIETGHLPTTSTLKDLFQGLRNTGQIYKAFVFYKYTMLKGFQLNHLSYVILTKGLCDIGETKIAIRLLRETLESKQHYETFNSMYHSIILRLCIDRHLNEAYDLFSEMTVVKKINPSIIIYHRLVYGYCITGQFKQAIALFREFGEAPKSFLVTEQEVRAAKLITEQEVKAAKRAAAVLIKRNVKPDLASCQSVIGGLYNGGRVRVTRKVEELSLLFYRSFVAKYC